VLAASIITSSPADVPIGVVAVKKPNPSTHTKRCVLDKPRVIGQLYDYLLMLKSFHGLENVFGILSTYKKWRVCWLQSPQTDAIAAADTLEQLQKLKGTTDIVPRFKPIEVEDDDYDTDEPPEAPPVADVSDMQTTWYRCSLQTTLIIFIGVCACRIYMIIRTKRLCMSLVRC